MSAPTFTYSGNVYTSASAGSIDFPLTSTEGSPIGYLEKSHIHVYKSADDGGTWSELARPADWDFVSGGTVARLAAGISAGEWVKVQRITPSNTSYITFQASSLLTADQLNDYALFNTYLNQEQEDVNTAAVAESAASASASEASAAAAQADATAAITTANQALAAASGVAGDAANAAQAATLAIQYAFGTSPSVIRPIAGLEMLLIPENAAFSVGKPGQIPFGVGPVLSPGAAFFGINRSDYFPIHHASGSFC